MAAHPFAVLPQRTRGMSYLESPICIPAPVAFLYAKQGPKQLPSSTKPLVWITDLTSNYTSIYPQSVVRQSPPLHLSESLFIHSLQYSAYIHDNQLQASTLTNQEWNLKYQINNHQTIWANQALGPLAHIPEAQWESPKATWVPAISAQQKKCVNLPKNCVGVDWSKNPVMFCKQKKHYPGPKTKQAPKNYYSTSLPKPCLYIHSWHPLSEWIIALRTMGCWRSTWFITKRGP